MSWAAHQFEVYAVQAHLPKKMRGKVSFWAIFLGDFTPDFLSKFWVYGITINGTHYGSSIPHQWHRGWPGMGITHTLFMGILLTAAFWLWKRNRAFTVGYLLGYAAHALTDVNDSVGTMLLFPFTTLNWTLQTWAYAATIDGRQVPRRRRLLLEPRAGDGPVLARRRAVVVARASPASTGAPRSSPPTPRVWAWFGRWLPERGLLALYRATFFYGVCRLIAWSDLGAPRRRPGHRRVSSGAATRSTCRWTGPWWIGGPHAAARQPVDRRPGDAGAAGAGLLGGRKLWEPMGRAEAARRAARPANPGAG